MFDPPVQKGCRWSVLLSSLFAVYRSDVWNLTSLVFAV